MIAFGLVRFARGVRRANPLLAAFGLAVLFIGWVRRQERAREGIKLHTVSIEPGEELHFTMIGPAPRRRR